MNSSKLITRSSEYEKYQQYSLEIHQKKLKQINKKSSNLFSNPVTYKLKKKKNVNSERELDKSNLKLLEKLIKIAKNKEKNTFRSLTPMPKTLNSIIRKKEAFRISEENKRIAERIARKSPVLSSKFFEKEYELQNKYKDIISKYSLLKQKKSWSIRKFETIEKSSKTIEKIDKTKEEEKEIQSVRVDNDNKSIE